MLWFAEGIEGAIHAMRELFDLHSDDGWSLLLVDARNAFNSVNCMAALWNDWVLWPRRSRFCSIPTVGMPGYLFKSVTSFCLAKRV